MELGIKKMFYAYNEKRENSEKQWKVLRHGSYLP